MDRFRALQRGADRAGVVVACYPIEHDGWSNRQALQEARRTGRTGGITDKIGDLIKKTW